MKYFYSLMLCASLMFTSCTEGSDSTEELKLAEGIPTEIIVGDDGTADVKEIKFEASSSWTATVRNVSENRSGGSEVEWLELNKYNGQAGENTIILSISKNETYESRKAEIVIQCGNSTITIIVEQYMRSDGNQGGEITDSELVKSIKITMVNSPEDVVLGEYTYDDNGRVVQLISGPEKGGLPRQTISVIYSENKLEITEKNESHEPSDSYTQKYELELNEAGDAVKMYDLENDGSKKISYDFKYDSDGRLIQIQDYISNEVSSVEKITYEGGLLKSYEYEDFQPEGSSDSFTYVVNLETAYQNKYRNNGNFDKVSMLLQFFGESYYTLYYLGVMGKTSDLLPESARFVRNSSKEEDKFSYEFDGKGRVVKMTIDESDWGGGDQMDRYIEFTY